jgi:5'-AMP-activated protein kinase catalytic alpha subunit
MKIVESATTGLRIGSWNLIEEIGSGNTSTVFIGVNQRTEERAAIKIFFDTISALSAWENEKAILSSLCHDNIIFFKDSFQAMEFINSQGHISKASALVMELATSGSFLELVQHHQLLTEKVARRYFLQLIEALEHLHSRQIAHRDIKLENILLNSDDDIKIADFGYSSKMDPSTLFTTPVGTVEYFAPEINSGYPHHGEQADLFAAGVFLFAVVTGHMPFERAVSADKLYQMLWTRDYKTFWAFHEKLVKKTNEGILLSEELKDLVVTMLDKNPDRRLKATEIKMHPWMQGDYDHNKFFKKRSDEWSGERANSKFQKLAITKQLSPDI